MAAITTKSTSKTHQLSAGLEPYVGNWTQQEASHLLRRASFGPTRQEIIDATAMGMNDAVQALLAPQALPAPPVNYYYPEAGSGDPPDPNVPIGTTWIDQPFLENVDVGQYRWGSLRGWLYNSLQEPVMSVREKMLLFWNNHFGMADVGDHRVQYSYITLFRNFATGNFRDLVKAVTIHPSMLVFLNGEYSHKDSPNENYARELLELFTIGKGPQVGLGDYTNYTELDIQQIARSLTGWRNAGLWSTDSNQTPHSYFDSSWHDTGTKTMSARFDEEMISDQGDQEYLAIIDMIFAKEEVAKFICRKLYKYFVYYKIDDTIEQEVIAPMAQVLLDADYEIAAVLDVLFKSAHFYEAGVAGDVIKNPIEFMLGITRPLNWGQDNFDLLLKYDSGRALHWWASQLDMDFFYPPSVSGWPSWHLAPAFNRLWLNSSTLQRRVDLTQGVGWSGIWVNGESRPMGWLDFIASFDEPYYPNQLITQFTRVFLPQVLLQEQLDELKESLIPGLPDFEWTDEYTNHLANPDDEMLRSSVENKLKSLARTIFRMAEFQLN